MTRRLPSRLEAPAPPLIQMTEPLVPPPTESASVASPSGEAILAEVIYRARESPILAYRPGEYMRQIALWSTHRGTLVCSGGVRSQKTWTAMAKAYLIATRRWSARTCPLTCPQHGKGSCGAHCCPAPERGTANLAREGCIAPHARSCPVHRAFDFPSARTIFIVIGVTDYKHWWGDVYESCLTHLMDRNPDESPTWHIEQKDNRLVANDGSWIMQALSYTDGPEVWQGWAPHFIVANEFPDFEIWRAQVRRLNTHGTQLFMAATPEELLRGRQQYLVSEFRMRHRLPGARVQWLRFRSLDNVFLSSDGRRQMMADAADLIARGKLLEYQVCYEGDIFARQDACRFTQRCIDTQTRFLTKPRRAWVVVANTGSAPLDYFTGQTTFPDKCELGERQREELVAGRVLSAHGGVACYDCRTSCEHQWRPPIVRRMEKDERPRLVDGKPPEQIEAVEVMVWRDPQPGHVHCLGGDVAKGLVGGDYSCIYVADATTGEIVAGFHGQVNRETYAAIVYAFWARYEKWARNSIVIEENGYGAEVLERLMRELCVPARDIFHRLDKTRRLPNGNPIPRAGFWTTRGAKTTVSTLELPWGTRPGPLTLLNDYCETQELIVHDEGIVAEMQTFVMTNNTIGALSGAHDDRAIAAALCALGYDTARNEAAAVNVEEIQAAAIPRKREWYDDNREDPGEKWKKKADRWWRFRAR